MGFSKDFVACCSHYWLIAGNLKQNWIMLTHQISRLYQQNSFDVILGLSENRLNSFMISLIQWRIYGVLCHIIKSEDFCFIIFLNLIIRRM